MKLIRDVKEKALAVERVLDKRMSALTHAPGHAPHPLEIHNDILDRIEQQAIAGPGGSHLFPYDEVTLELPATLEGRAAALEAMFDRAGGLVEEVRQRLAQRDCHVAPTLSCRIHHVAAVPADWPRHEWYRLTFRRSPRDERDTLQRPQAELLFDAAAGNQPPSAYALVRGSNNVGRVPEVRDHRGRLIRRNAICIGDTLDPRSTVSRRHAHVRATFGAAGRPLCILFDDGSTHGTRVIREGSTIIVHPGAVGVTLRDGDELYFGDARATIRLTG